MTDDRKPFSVHPQPADFLRSQHYTPSAELLDRYKKGFASKAGTRRPALDDDAIVAMLRQQYASTPEAAEQRGAADADEGTP